MFGVLRHKKTYPMETKNGIEWDWISRWGEELIIREVFSKIMNW